MNKQLTQFVLNTRFSACEILKTCRIVGYTKLDSALLTHIRKNELSVEPLDFKDHYNFYLAFLKPFGEEKQIDPSYHYVFPDNDRQPTMMERIHYALAFNTFWDYFETHPGEKRHKVETMIYSIVNLNDPFFLEWPLEIQTESLDTYVIWLCTSYLLYASKKITKHRMDFVNFEQNIGTWTSNLHSYIFLLPNNKEITLENLQHAIALLRLGIMCLSHFTLVEKDQIKKWCVHVQMRVRKELYWYNDFLVCALRFYELLNEEFMIVNYYEEMNRLNIQGYPVRTRIAVNYLGLNNKLIPMDIDYFVENYDEDEMNPVRFYLKYYLSNVMPVSNDSELIEKFNTEKELLKKYISEHLHN